MPKASSTFIPLISLKKFSSSKVALGYPWVYSDWIATESVIATTFAGELVHITDAKGKFIASGIADPNSAIAIRIIATQKITLLDEEYFINQLSISLKKRSLTYKAPYYRLVNSEGDNLPGLVVDRFDNVLSIQFTTPAMLHYKDIIIASLVKLFEPVGMIVRILKEENPLIIGQVKEQIPVNENGVQYLANLLHGQKTGWYFDQRENRKLVSSFATDKTVLDAFCYNGGFGILCAIHQAKHVTFIDSSNQAIETVKINAQSNQLSTPLTFLASDVYETLNHFVSDNKQFDLVVLDPPPFIKSKQHKAQAVAKYHKLALLGFKVLAPNGKLFYSTCSHHMSKTDLLKTLQAASKKLNIKFKVIAITGHPSDHPVHPHLPESHYLNSVFLERLD